MEDKKRGKGRPPAPNGKAKSRVIQFRVSESEYERIAKSAISKGKGENDWAREIILAASSVP